MDGLSVNSTVGKQKPRHKITCQISRDIYCIAREGSLSELDFALVQLKRIGGNIDAKNILGLTALHIATWRNHLPIVKRLLAAGADPNTRDSESGWTSLHRSVHFGHLAVAGVLLKFGASLTIEDSKGRTPVDLLCGPVCQVIGGEDGSAVTEVFSWGNGANYQLGTGNADIQKLPCKVETLQGTYVKIVAAAKFHSVAVGANGELYTWGFGRGGRLGHPDFDIHSGQAAVITPRQVINGLGHRRVKAVSAAKHHTVVATEAGEVFTWGSNREGQLGYTSVDTQVTPRRVSSLKSKIVAVAAANKHTVVVSESGEVFSWGCNKEGQLGYGTSNSASNYTPRVVEYLKSKQFVAVSTAKYHTLVLGADGEVYTWGNRMVNPRRVAVSRNTKKSGSIPLKFHRQERLHVVAVAAGMVHSSALTSDGALFYWVSSDPDLRCQQLYSMCDRHFVSISAGKYWTSAVTNTGDVYMWDGKKCEDVTPIACRLHGVKHATLVSSGETHLLMISTLYQPPYSSKADKVTEPKNVDKAVDDLDEGFILNDSQRVISPVENDNSDILAPSLKSLCQKTACKFIVEPRNAIQLLEIADALEADDLWSYCEDIALHNIDFILSLAPSSVSNASPEILAKLERSLDERSSEPWSCRQLPTATATFPAVLNSEEEGGCGSPQLRMHQTSADNGVQREGIGFLQQESAADQAISKQIRAVRKKLQQIDMLEAKLAKGQPLDEQQIVKVQSRPYLEGALAELGMPVEAPKSPGVVVEGKSSRKGGSHKKHRPKYKQKNNIVKPCEDHAADIEPNSFEGYTCDVDNMGSKLKVDVEPGGISNFGSHEKLPSFGQRENQKPLISKSGSTKNTRRKGGLSLFLSGGLDETPPSIASPPSPKRFVPTTPAWGGVKCSTGSTSLLDIQEEQKKMERSPGIKGKDGYEGCTTERGGSASIKLGSFFPGSSSPIAVSSSCSPAAPEGDKSTPPWAVTGTSPILCRPSLRDIQIQEEKRQLHLTSHSPKTRSQGFTVGSTSETGLSGTPKETTPNRWYKPETDAPSSIRAIQIEEAAIKDLKRYYSNVKIVKKPVP